MRNPVNWWREINQGGIWRISVAKINPTPSQEDDAAVAVGVFRKERNKIMHYWG